MTATAFTERRELAHRTSDGIEVTATREARTVDARGALSRPQALASEH